MALGADRYASRADTLAFIGCVMLSVAAMSPPERGRDPVPRRPREPEPSGNLTFIISAGRKQGVKPLTAVVSPEGLVGIVSSVDAQTGVVVTWAHPDFRASAMAADGSVYGIVAPHGTEGPRVWLL